MFKLKIQVDQCSINYVLSFLGFLLVIGFPLFLALDLHSRYFQIYIGQYVSLGSLRHGCQEGIN